MHRRKGKRWLDELAFTSVKMSTDDEFVVALGLLCYVAMDMRPDLPEDEAIDWFITYDRVMRVVRERNRGDDLVVYIADRLGVEIPYAVNLYVELNAEYYERHVECLDLVDCLLGGYRHDLISRVSDAEFEELLMDKVRIKKVKAVRREV